MFSTRSFVAAAAAFSLISPSVAAVTPGSLSPVTYVDGGNANLVTYWVWNSSVLGVLGLMLDRGPDQMKKSFLRIVMRAPSMSSRSHS
jgi:hypothetical protein